MDEEIITENKTNKYIEKKIATSQQAQTLIYV